MKKLTPEQFKEYMSNPAMADENVRRWAGVPEDKYYTVAIFPENQAGDVRVLPKSHREVKAKKISKSG